MDILKRRQEKLKHTRARTNGDTLGQLALWYGRGKVVFSGKLTIINSNNTEVLYRVILLNPNKDSAKYVVGGMINVPNKQNEYPNRRQDKRKFEPEDRVGSIYIYESSTTSGYYAMVYFDEEINNHGISYIVDLEESDSDNPKAPVMIGPVRFLTPKEPDWSKKQRNVKRKEAQVRGAKDNPYFKRVAEPDFNRPRVQTILELIEELSIDEVKDLAHTLLKISNQNDELTEDYEIVNTSDFDDESLFYKNEEEDTPVIQPPKKRRIATTIEEAPNVDKLDIRVKKSIASDLIDMDDEEVPF